MKHADIVHDLRELIVRGQLAPGDQLPTRATLERRFGASPVTVQRALDVLRAEGFTVASGRRGTHVTTHPPHLRRVGLVFARSETPQHRWNRFMVAMRAMAKSQAWSPVKIVPHVADAGHPASAAFQAFERDVASCRFAGLIVMDGSAEVVSSICRRHGRHWPQVHVTADPQFAWRVALDAHAWGAMASARLAAAGRRRTAVLASSEVDPDTADWKRFLATLAREGVATRDGLVFGLDKMRPRWARHCVEALWSQRPRPDACLVLDDNLVEEVATAITALPGSAAQDMCVIAHCNFPIPPSVRRAVGIPVQWLGYDVRQVLDAALALLAVQVQRKPGKRADQGQVITIAPRFEPSAGL